MSSHEFLNEVTMRVNTHVYQSPFTHESRMLRMTQTITEYGLFDKVVIFATWEPGLPVKESLNETSEVWRIRTRLVPRACRGRIGQLMRKLEWLARVLVSAARLPLACLNAHSLLVLPGLVLLKWLKGCRLIYDTHELETETQTLHGPTQRVAKLVERVMIRAAESVVVVNDSIAEWYRREYPAARVYVVRNTPPRPRRAAPENNLLRKALSIPDSDLLFLYQGGLGRHRGIELLLKAFARVSRDRHIVFMGFGPLEAEVRAAQSSNIHFHPAVKPGELPDYTAGADVGIVLYENICLNHYCCLPNKIFEYMAAGVPVVVSDFPEMAKVVELRGGGWQLPVCEDAVVDFVSQVSREETTRRKQPAVKTASEFCWENEVPTLLSVYEDLGFSPAHRTDSEDDKTTMVLPAGETEAGKKTAVGIARRSA